MAIEERNESVRTGGISVETQHIFPIIKKWLYSEKEIFLRELVSNACDAITKLKRLISLGHVRDIEDKFRIDVLLDKDARTITVSDNGIGMTAEELEKYICQIALSGAVEFIRQYEGKEGENASGIIGHFGLGFYSAFMVADTVEIITKSYTDAPAVRWECNSEGEYRFYPSDRTERGTTVILHIVEDESEFLSEYKIRDILDKYCAFMPVEIYFTDVSKKEDTKDQKDGEKKDDEPEKPINDTNPLWLKNPSDCTEEEYKEFYRKVFRDFREPLFYIHINADYPLNFRGIIYFPQLRNEYENLEGQIKLYYNQVFVADNIKEVIPEYMLMLRGVVDCPELPLNVSRSYLQNDAYVKKISAHIVKKVADKLNSLFTTERERYEKLWNDIKLFVEYACIRDKKFLERVKDNLLLPLTDGTFKSMSEYLSDAKEKHPNTIYYATSKTEQAQYISMYNSEGIEVALLDKVLDTSYIQTLEDEKWDGHTIRFVRVDADIAKALKGDGEEYKSEALEKLFKKVSGKDDLKVTFEVLKSDMPAIINLSEQSRRFGDMMKLYSMSSGEQFDVFEEDITLVLNSKSQAIRKLGELAEAAGENFSEEQMAYAKRIYMLALMAQRRLTPDELREFLEDSYKQIEKSLA
ncbi:MAG TPA: molecular chaperone HtpG [Bacillota bacterium]|nr:molecular chaperone HtpG [Bacillota bacterium]